MDYETSMKLENGEMPDDWYRVASDENELAAIIVDLQDGGTIRKDARLGFGFHFGLTVGGRWYFATDEFLDDDEKRENPDFHESRYASAAEGVRFAAVMNDFAKTITELGENVKLGDLRCKESL